MWHHSGGPWEAGWLSYLEAILVKYSYALSVVSCREFSISQNSLSYRMLMSSPIMARRLPTWLLMLPKDNQNMSARNLDGGRHWPCLGSREGTGVKFCGTLPARLLLDCSNFRIYRYICLILLLLLLVSVISIAKEHFLGLQGHLVFCRRNRNRRDVKDDQAALVSWMNACLVEEGYGRCQIIVEVTWQMWANLNYSQLATPFCKLPGLPRLNISTTFTVNCGADL